MSDDFHSPAPGDGPAVEVPLGDSLPPAPPPAEPLRLAMRAPIARRDGALPLTTLCDGMSFTGDADVDGSFLLSGEFQGNVRIAEHCDGQVTIDETGVLVGDVRSRHIAVLGQSTGLLDAGGGDVLLHASSVVSGKIRYTHLQVNGADLNAQLERVRAEGEPQRRR